MFCWREGFSPEGQRVFDRSYADNCLVCCVVLLVAVETGLSSLLHRSMDTNKWTVILKAKSGLKISFVQHNTQLKVATTAKARQSRAKSPQ